MRQQIGRSIRLGLGAVATALVGLASFASPANAAPANVSAPSSARTATTLASPHQTTSARTVKASPKAVKAYTGCKVQTDSNLWCGNNSGSDILSLPQFDTPSRYRDTLVTSYSWFDCWTSGQLHDGGNTTWYHTQGDYYGNWGYVPASIVYTASWFDANPSAYGLRHC